MRLLRAIVAGALGACAALVVACGDSNGLLSGNDASALNAKLDAISVAAEDGRCAAAARRTAELQDAVVNLPGTVSRKLLVELRDGTRTVGSQAAQACREAATTTTETTDTTTTDTTTTDTTATTETTPTQTVTTPTQTVTTPTQTVTTPTQTTPTQTTPTTPPTPTTTTPGGGGAGPPSGGATPGQ